jgi:hypothetical protein
VVLGLAIGLERDRRNTDAKQAARRWDLEYDSLGELGDLLPTFADGDPFDMEVRKQRVVMLAWRVRDDRASTAVELLIVQPVNSQQWNDQIGNAVRAVGMVMRDL